MPATVLCPKCGKRNSIQNDYCPRCGEPLRYADEENYPPPRRRSGFWRGVLLLIGIVVVVKVLMDVGGQQQPAAVAPNAIDTPLPTETPAPTEPPAPTPTSAPQYNVRLTGTYQAVERVGQLATFKYTIENTGDAVIPNYTLRFHALDPWIIQSVTSDDCTSKPTKHEVIGTEAWSVGPVYVHGSCSITVILLPLEEGTHTLTTISFYAPDDDAYINSGDGDLAAKVAVLAGF